MLNLLTPEHKKRILAEYHKRLIIVVLGGVLFTIIVSIVFLIPSYVLVKAKKTELEGRSQSLKTSLKLQKESDVELKKIVDDTNATLKVLKVPTGTSTPSMLITQTAARSVSGAVFNHLAYSQPSLGAPTVMEIGGIAKSREVLINLASSLQAGNLFSGVAFPPAIFAHETAIPFSLKLQVIQK